VCVQLHIAVFLFGLSDLALFSAHVLRDGMEVSGDPDRGGDLLTRGQLLSPAMEAGVVVKCEEQHDVGELQVSMWKPELKISNAIRSGGLI
jgi:hypothetical protein